MAYMAMQRLVLAMAAVMAMAMPVTQVRAQGASTGNLSSGRAISLHRTTLVVGDIDKSVDFYQRLGLMKITDTAGSDGEGDGIFGATDLPLTADPKRSRHIIMKGSDERAGLLVLVWYDRPPLPSARGNLIGIGTGDVIIGLEVPDLQTAYGKLNQIGTRFQRSPVRFTQPRR